MEERNDTFVVGQLIDNMTVFNMVAYYPVEQANRRFIGVGVNVDGELQFPSDQLSRSVVGLSHYPIMYFTATRIQPSTVIDGVRTSYYVFKVFDYSQANSIIGYLGSVNNTIRLVTNPQILTVTTTDPSTFNDGDNLLTGVRYSIGTVTIYPCTSVYDRNNTPDPVIVDIINDRLNLDLDDDIFDNPNSPATTTWCNGIGTAIHTITPSIIFLPVNWYLQNSCNLSLMSRSLLDTSLTASYGGRQYPPSVYMLQCMTNNGDVYNDSIICDNVRRIVSYTTQSTCTQYSNIGKFFYGDICGQSNPNYPGIFGTVMNANQVVGPCDCPTGNDNCITSCIFSYNRIQCVQDVIPESPQLEPVPNNTLDQYRWRLIVFILLILTFLILIVITVILARR